jgi:salicylate hydroxylase
MSLFSMLSRSLQRYIKPLSFKARINYLTDAIQVGAGIRVPPNSSRLLRQLGVDLDSIKKEVSHGNRFVDWKDHKRILLAVSFEDFPEKYGTPYYFIHRADLVDALLKAARKNTEHIAIKTSSRVIEYAFDRPAVKTEQGVWFTGDIVISAEGIKSSTRATINGVPLEPRDTGDVAYRIVVPAGPLLEDPETKSLVTEPWATHWIGPEAHAVGYPLRGGELYNIIIDITHNTDMGEPVREGDWKKQADNTELVKRLKDWCLPVRKLCGLTDEYLKWKLADLERPLQRWVHPSGKVALLGDACHPMMPYMAQGAAQAIEDAACLRSVLAAYGHESIPKALRAYETQRAPRANYIAKNTRVLQEWWHLYDGPARDKRDEMMLRDDETNPMFWGYSARKDWLFGLDATKLVDKVEGLQIPKMPPMPPAEVSVYRNLGKDARL